MEQNILPSQCKRCGAIFDLGYEIREESLSELKNKEASFLCWGCKKQDIRNKNQVNEDEFEDPLEEDILDLEFD